MTVKQYARSINQMARQETGWKFSALNASSDQLEDFKLEDMARDMQSLAPELWGMLGDVLSASGQTTEKKVVLISIMLQSSNQKCNALQSIYGIFLHSCNTPQRVIHALARMGISTSPATILNAIRSLSHESITRIQAMGQTLLVGYVYDNFDVDFKTSAPTYEKRSVDTLTHLTSGMLVKLDHGVTLDDLRCSQQLWDMSPINPANDAPTLPPRGCLDLMKLHPETAHSSGLSRREQWNAYKFLTDLIQYGPEYFRQFKVSLRCPEAVDKIPLAKMTWQPARAMDINQSKVAGNIQAIAELLDQGGVGDPTEPVRGTALTMDVVDMREYVILCHGDLGTAERVQSVLERRSLEATPWRRYQFVIFVMGLFHLKMACADAIWRIFLEPKTARDDVNSLMHFVALSRPRETGKIGSNPSFRQMHEVIGYTGIALRLDAWRVEAKKENSAWSSLELLASAKPSLEMLEGLANNMAVNCVAGSDTIYEQRSQPASTRDKQQENMMLLHQYFLLYEELSWAMNEGDIGRIETLFPPWIFLFRATGKHKYAKHMVKFMTDVHFMYPERLRHAVRYNMLVNPTGKNGHARALDWVMEAANLDIKHTFGGDGSNYTKKCVLDESPLIKVYRMCHSNMERNLSLPGPTKQHAAPNMTKTLAKILTYLQEHSPNEFCHGREARHIIPDMLDKGQHILYTNDDQVDSMIDDIGRLIEPEDLTRKEIYLVINCRWVIFIERGRCRGRSLLGCSGIEGSAGRGQ
ncbi:hypothetical protein C8R48DRAFT_750575 [Suillus tomentosus]|nr:hypothetical protein C8R48DRAFT_750575 [Suillus tomentosus]